jgi:hypothetical protein
MTMNDHSPYVKASFYTSFFDPSQKKKLPRFTGLPVSPINRTFLQTPLWLNKSSTPTPAALQQAVYILPKSPSNVSIYLQVPQFRSMALFLRCGHVSQLVENWLCNPMDQLKKKAASVPLSQDHHRNTSSLNSLPSSSLQSNLSVVKRDSTMMMRRRNSNLISSMTVYIQEHIMEFEYTHVPSSYTIVCVTYHLGHISLSVYQVESLDILLSLQALNSFLIKCQLQPEHPVTIHSYRPSLPMICDFEHNPPENPPLLLDMPKPIFPRLSTLRIEEVSLDTTEASICIEEGLVDKQDMPTAGFVHYQDMYQEDDDDDDEESGLYSSSEEFSLIDDDDQDLQEDIYEDPYERAQAALLRLAQDTLQYIQSSSQGAFTEELNSLQSKLYDYCQRQTSIV